MRILKSSYVHKDPYRYHMQPELYSALTQDKVIREAALRNGDIVRRVTSTSGDVVTEPDVGNVNDKENNSSSHNGSGSNGGSSGNTGTVTPSTGEGGDEG